MVCATIPKSSSNFCNVTTSYTKPAAQTISDMMDLLREWSELLRNWWTKLENHQSRGSQVCLIRVTPQSGSIASPLQLLTQCTPREKNLPQLPSTLGTQEMYQTHQELLKRQRNKPEKSCIELTPGTPVWIQHRQNATWEPATLINQCALNSYWIMQENGTEQPNVYRCTRTMLKIRSTPTDVKWIGHMKDWSTETRKSESNIPAIPNTVRDSVHKNSLENVSSDPVQSTLPRLDLPQAAFDSEDREEIAESLCTDENALETPETNGQNTPYTPGSSKSTRKNFGKPASSFSDFYMQRYYWSWISGLPVENVEL